MFETLTKILSDKINSMETDEFVLFYQKSFLLNRGNFETHKEFLKHHNIKLDENCVLNLYKKLKK